MSEQELEKLKAEVERLKGEQAEFPNKLAIHYKAEADQIRARQAESEAECKHVHRADGDHIEALGKQIAELTAERDEARRRFVTFSEHQYEPLLREYESLQAKLAAAEFREQAMATAYANKREKCTDILAIAEKLAGALEDILKPQFDDRNGLLSDAEALDSIAEIAGEALGQWAEFKK